ncbi:sulfurtransferase TusA family protein [Phenylobacterium sp.]|uniref:sulfurtransferase TusA family protein n=1 Tax=Phenylobacterium sp. TaxID=1871053 RepID=UPI00273160E2|nr:sulfurtransferase TusA family protein [Phenylobacterium sp.]MDP1618420.1 sulfurtransferase TusA family protein [Phenylobacterium sp.]MDP1987550.1 sulfurtransferase TusA family protein [Phenylobacterium sp.]
MSPPEILVDARGHRCPVPTLRLRRALEAAPPGARIRLLADDPLARIDVPHFAAAVGAVVIAQEMRDGALSFLVEKSVSGSGDGDPAEG